jgi:DNA polymerase III alpha subunit
MKINEYHQIEISEKQAFDLLYSGKVKDLSNIFLDDSNVIEQFNRSRTVNADSFSNLKSLEIPNSSVEEFHKNNQKNWLMPEEYKTMDIEAYLVDQCPSQNYERLVEELDLFRQHGMMDLLRYLKYLVDTMRQNRILWGVGRGSSVSSYVLYLLGVHKVDSIKYDLDIKEFLK